MPLIFEDAGSTANSMGGNVTIGLKYKSLLGSNMMPVIGTITGGGNISSQSIQILQSKTFDMMKSVLKINQAYSNTIKDLKATFAINNERLFVNPFDTKIGNIKLNISGDQGLDKTLNYVVRTKMPGASTWVMLPMPLWERLLPRLQRSGTKSYSAGNH